MKRLILLLFITLHFNDNAQIVHTSGFFKKVTKKNIDIEEYLKEMHFGELTIYDTSKINLLTKPDNAGLFNMKADARLFLGEDEYLYVVKVNCSEKENWSDHIWLSYRLLDNLRPYMCMVDVCDIRNYRFYIKTTEGDYDIGYLIIPYGAKRYDGKKTEKTS